MTSGNKARKSFDTLTEAIRFSVYQIPFQSLFGIEKINKPTKNA